MKKHLFSFSFFLVLLSSCCPSGKDNDYKRVATALKESVPYVEGQTVKFVGSDGSSYSLNVTKKLEEVYSDFNKCSGQTLEFLQLELKNGQGTPVINFGTNYTTDEQMTIEVLTKEFAGGGEYGIIHYFVNEDGSFQCDEKFNYEYTCHPSLTIGGKNYSNSLEINQIELNPTEDNLLTALFYSQIKGVLQYSFSNGTTYTLSEN